MKKDLLCLLDLEPQDFTSLFERALSLKERHKKGIFDSLLAGKTLGLIFDKKSTRTRIAFETAMIQLGGHSIYMSTQDTRRYPGMSRQRIRPGFYPGTLTAWP